MNKGDWIDGMMGALDNRVKREWAEGMNALAGMGLAIFRAAIADGATPPEAIATTQAVVMAMLADARSRSSADDGPPA